MGSLVIGAFFYLFPKGLKWYWLSLPFLGSALLLACQIFLVPSMPSSWDVGIWLLYCLLWAVFAIYTFMKNKHPQQRRLLVVFRKVFPQYSFALIVGEVFLPLLLVFIFIYLFPLIIHMSIVNTWTRESEYQYILFVAFTAAFLVNLLFSSLFLQQRLTEQGEARQQSLMIPILICLFLGVFAFILSVKLHDGFSRMVLHNIGMVETQKNAMWYALVTPEKREYLRPKMERHNWTNGEPKNSEYKYLHGYLALNMGDIRLLCPKNAAWQRNLAEQCLQLTKADLVPFGASTSPLYIPRCLAAQLKPANTLIKTSYILPALAGNPSCKIPLRYSQ